MKVDAHQHFWRYDPEKYAWIGDGMDVLKRDFTPADLAREIEGIVDTVVSVQARQDVDETRELLDVARREPFVVGVVGWVPLVDPRIGETLEELVAEPYLVGVRHVLQDEPDDAYVLRDDFNHGVARLKEFELVYDVLIYERQLPNAIRFVDRHPNQPFVVDHLAKPRIRDRDPGAWSKQIRALARREHCYCKISGMVTEARWDDWTREELMPYLDTVLEAFGPERLMFGSDWPVCLLASDYRAWYRLIEDYAAELSVSEKARIWGETAAEVYSLHIR